MVVTLSPIIYNVYRGFILLNNSNLILSKYLLTSVTAKQSLQKSGQAQKVARVWDSQISVNRHKKVVRLLALFTGRFYPQQMFLVLISVRGWVDSRARVLPEGLYQWIISLRTSGINPAIFRLVAQCLNQLRHLVHPRSKKKTVLVHMSIFTYKLHSLS